MNMYISSLGKGRKKKVKKFKFSNGLWILGVVNAILITLVLLWMLGYLHFDVD